MELWLVLVLVAAVGASISAFFDNYITDVFFKERTPQAAKCLYGPICLIFALSIIISYQLNGNTPEISILNLGLILLSAILSSIGSIPYYLALKTENTTGAMIFSQLSPIFYLILGFLFLGEKITGVQLIAFLILLLSSGSIIFFSKKRSKKTEIRAALLFVLYIFMHAVAGIIYIFATRGIKTTVDNNNVVFFAYAILMAAKGVFDTLCFVFVKKWRIRCKNVLRQSKRKVLIPIVVNQAIWFVADFALKYSQVSGQAAIVSVVSMSAELVITFILGVILTAIWPRFGREKLDRRTVVVHFLAVFLAVIGIILLEKPDILLQYLS